MKESNEFRRIKEKITILLSSLETSKSIAEETGISDTTIRNYRSEKFELNKMRLETAEKLYLYQLSKEDKE